MAIIYQNIAVYQAIRSAYRLTKGSKADQR